MFPLIKCRTYRCFLLGALFLFSFGAGAQQTGDTTRRVPVDSLSAVADTSIAQRPKVDSVLRRHSPRKAAIRSAIVPGWGQAYNRRYWKIPIVYAALGGTAAVFVNNLQWYRRTRFAYTALVTKDSASFPKVHPQLQFYITNDQRNRLQYYRDDFRRNLDYSVLYFLIAWGLNVVDATVDAHLRSFDVSPDLSFRFKAGYSELGKTNGISLILAFK